MKLIQQLNTHTWFIVPDDTEESLIQALISLLSRNSCSQEELNLLLDLADPNHEIESSSIEELHNAIIDKLKSRKIIYYIFPTVFPYLFMSSKSFYPKYDTRDMYDIREMIDFIFWAGDGDGSEYTNIIDTLGITLEDDDDIYYEDWPWGLAERVATDALIQEAGIEFFILDPENTQWYQFTHGFDPSWTNELGMLFKNAENSKYPNTLENTSSESSDSDDLNKYQDIITFIHPEMNPILGIYRSLDDAKYDILKTLMEKKIIVPIDSVPEYTPSPEPAVIPRIITEDQLNQSEEESQQRQVVEPYPGDLPF